MREEQVVTGIILYTTLVGEYDKRLVMLTKERGKITVFANGARRPNSMLRAASQSFVMGSFTVTAGKDAYNLHKAEVKEYFTEMSQDMEKMCYASYFCELMAYYVHEGDFCVNHLNLLYLTFKALIRGDMDQRLLRCIYEIRLMDMEGQAMHAFSCVKCNEKQVSYFDAKIGGFLCKKCATEYSMHVSETLVYTVQFILSIALEKLYSFSLKDENLNELIRVTERFRKQYIDKNFKSLEILDSLA